MMTILNAIFLNARCEPQKPALVLGVSIVTYDMLAQGILSTRKRASLSGIRSSQFVIVALTNPIRHLILSLALMHIGAISMSVEEADDQAVKALGADWILVDDLEDVSDKSNALMITDQWFHDLDVSAGSIETPYTFEVNEVCRVISSSGTTGAPKPFAFTPEILADRLYTRIALNTDSYAERTLIAPSISSQMGWVGALAGLAVGNTVFFAVSAETTLQMVDTYAISNLTVTANQMRELAECKKAARFTTHSLRTVQIGAGLLSDELMGRLRAEFCSRILCRYGSTETGIVAYAPGAALSGHRRSVGYVAPWANAETVGANSQPLKSGEEGNLRVRTASLAQLFERGKRFVYGGGDQWFYPGDTGRVDEQGLMFVTGRIGSVINIGGVKISPELVEEILAKQPGVKDCAVFGMLGASGFEELWAVVNAEETTSDANLVEASNAKFPNAPLCRIIWDIVPRNSSGKISRDILRYKYADQP